MNITKVQKKFIKQNYKKLPLEEIAKKTGLSSQEIEQYLRKKGKEIKQKQSIDTSKEYKSLKDLGLIIKRNLPFLLLLLTLVILVFANSLKGDFVSDDMASYVENKTLADFDSVLASRTLQSLLYYISYNTVDQDSLFLHSASVLSHYVAVVIFFVLFYMKFGKKPAMIATTLFSVHPVLTEAVSWVSGINYIFQAIHTLILVILYTLYRNSGNKVYLISAVVFFAALNLMSINPWTLVIPVTIVVWDQFFLHDRIKYENLIRYIPLFLVSILIFLIKLIPAATERVNTLYMHPEERSPYWLTFPYTVFMTFKLMLFPDKLTLYHEGEALTPLFFNITRVFLLAMIIFVPYLLIKKRRTGAGIILIIFASILPALSPIQVAWFIAERYLYFGTAFFCLMLAFLFLHIEKKWNMKYASLALTLLVLIGYSIRTMTRNVDWRTHKNLWLATYKVSPSSPKVHNNLGDIYTRENNYEKAIYHFERSSLLSPNFDAAHFNLARTYYIIRDLENAKLKFKDALRVNPRLLQAYYMLGVIEYEAGNAEGARQYYLKALEINPNDPDTLRAMQLLSTQPQPPQPVAP
jgi:tetratricopeptide (TPR) repeat protein